MQKILEATDHKDRCKLLKFFINAETRRLESKKTLKELFSSGGGDVAAIPDIPPEELISEDNDKPEQKPSVFFDEPDAFQ